MIGRVEAACWIVVIGVALFYAGFVIGWHRAKDDSIRMMERYAKKVIRDLFRKSV